MQRPLRGDDHYGDSREILMQVIVAALLATLGCILASPAIGADTQLSSKVSVLTSDGGSAVQASTEVATATIDRNGVFGTGTSRASFGVLTASDFAAVAPTQTTTSVGVFNEVSALDTLTITPAPGSVPTEGTPRPIVTGLFTASIIVTGTEPRQAEFSTTVPGLPFIGTQFTVLPLHTGTNQVSSIFLIGGPFQMSLSLAADTGTIGGSPSAPRSSAVDVSVRWGGISEVDVAGNSVPYTIASASGTDWALAAPVPEPPMIMLLAIALAGVGVRLRLGRRQGVV
jgi:hypothetical protein